MLNVTTMQKIDYYLGGPLCLIASVINSGQKFLRNFSPKKDLSTSVLFIELSEMGSAILASPAIKTVLANTKKEHCYFLIFQRNRESVDIQRLIPKENVLVIKDGSFFAFIYSVLPIIFKMRSLKLQATFDLELFSRCTALLTWLSGADAKIGFGSKPDEGPWRGSLFTKEVRYNPHLHMSQNFLAMITAYYSHNADQYLRQPIPELEIGLSVRTESVQLAARLSNLGLELPAKLILLNPDAGFLQLRAWPEESWVELIKQIELKYPNYGIAIIGIAKFKQKAADLINASRSQRVINLVGVTENLEELTSLMLRSNCLITSDSGPAHFASLAKLPTIVMFGPETPKLYRPLGRNVRALYSKLACSPCYSAYNHRKTDCHDNICMQTITVSEVLKSVEEFL